MKHKARVGFPLILTLVTVCQAAAQSETSTETRRRSVTPIVFQAAGPNAESIQSTVDEFRAALGGDDNGNAMDGDPPRTEGRREINWDGGGATNTAPLPPVTPFNVFLNTRGAQFTTLGTGLTQVPPTNDTDGGLAVLFDNPTYATIFDTFSPLRLFTPVGSNITQAIFFQPGSNGTIPARVTGFGAIFTDVDRQDGGDKHRGNRGASTNIEYFAANKRLLFRAVVPASPGDASLSFFGIVFEDPRIARVLITTGNAAPGPNDNDRRDIVMMDDFIYGEPQSRGRVTDVSPPEQTATEETATETDATSAAALGTPGLTVNNGSASGTAPGTVVTVTANPATAGQRFAGWTGDITILASPSEETTTATVPPTTPVTITATYEPSATEP